MREIKMRTHAHHTRVNTAVAICRDGALFCAGTVGGGRAGLDADSPSGPDPAAASFALADIGPGAAAVAVCSGDGWAAVATFAGALLLAVPPRAGRAVFEPPTVSGVVGLARVTGMAAAPSRGIVLTTAARDAYIVPVTAGTRALGRPTRLALPNSVSGAARRRSGRGRARVYYRYTQLSLALLNVIAQSHVHAPPQAAAVTAVGTSIVALSSVMTARGSRVDALPNAVEAGEPVEFPLAVEVRQ